jgi:hypothetical protein
MKSIKAIIIEVRGGVAEVTHAPANTRVIIFDWDDRDTGCGDPDEYAPRDYSGPVENTTAIIAADDDLTRYLQEENLIP